MFVKNMEKTIFEKWYMAVLKSEEPTGGGPHLLQKSLRWLRSVRDQFKLYELIWKRFVASQMSPAVMDVTTIDISADKYLFRASGSSFVSRVSKVYEDSSERG